jgi:hypothetical protein
MQLSLEINNRVIKISRKKINNNYRKLSLVLDFEMLRHKTRCALRFDYISRKTLTSIC